MIQNSLQSFTMRVVLLFVLGALCPAGPALSHGRLIEPPSRASAWRYGFATPHNYNDHELYCGGLTRQWRKNGGHCGVCGDAWDQKTPRPHEFGGRFGQGVTVRRYAVGATVSTRVELTAYHAGFYELRVCPHMENTTQECLDKHVLEMEGGGTRYYPQEGNKIYEVKFKLPSDLMCEHCVMQWRYIAGNNWGTCSNGTTGMGCGHQEEFRACADIAIAPAGRIGPSYVAPTRRPTTTTTDVNTLETADGETGATGATTESSTPDVQIKLDAPDLPAPRGSWLASLLPAGGTLLAVLAALALIYLYYYRGDRIKSLLKSRGRLAPAPPVVQAPPTRPPRHRKPADTVLEVRPDLDSKIEPGFETIKLNEHRII